MITLNLSTTFHNLPHAFINLHIQHIQTVPVQVVHTCGHIWWDHCTSAIFSAQFCVKRLLFEVSWWPLYFYSSYIASLSDSLSSTESVTDPNATVSSDQWLKRWPSYVTSQVNWVYHICSVSSRELSSESSTTLQKRCLLPSLSQCHDPLPCNRISTRGLPRLIWAN
jgi:hypothetical protein